MKQSLCISLLLVLFYSSCNNKYTGTYYGIEERMPVELSNYCAGLGTTLPENLQNAISYNRHINR